MALILTLQDGTVLRMTEADIAAARAAYQQRFRSAFDPDQPRDEIGRWTDTGGAKPDTHAGAPALGHAAHAPDWPVGPTEVRRMRDLSENVQRGNAWEHTLSVTEADAVADYMNKNYATMNTALREGTPPPPAVAVITESLAKAPSPPPPDLVWRGVAGGPLKEREVLNSLHVGDTVRLDGFQSTSIRPDFVETWSNKVVYEIKPTAGAFTRSLSEHPEEYEYLLPHGRTYTVLGVAQVPFAGTTYKAGREVPVVTTHTVVQLAMS